MNFILIYYISRMFFLKKLLKYIFCNKKMKKKSFIMEN